MGFYRCGVYIELLSLLHLRLIDLSVRPQPRPVKRLIAATDAVLCARTIAAQDDVC